MAPINICSYAVLIIYSGSKDSSQLLNNLIKTRAVQCWYLMNFVSHSLAKQLVYICANNMHVRLTAWNDAVEEACEAGVGVIAEPGGRSIRDKDAIDCCNKHGVSLFFTNVL
jgi:phosphoribosylaminoimidazolecarboxamide formyltransferase/IMP cyclohydrolase